MDGFFAEKALTAGRRAVRITGMRVNIITLALVGLAAVGTAQQPVAAIGKVMVPEVAAELPSETELMSMSRDSRCGQVLITCLVNGQLMRMMLDTGATHTVLHDESAARLTDAEWLDTSKMQFRGNSAQRPKIMLGSLSAGPAKMPRHAFMVVSLAAVRSMMSEPIDGIIGMDVLGRLPFTFDGRKGEYCWGVPEGKVLVPLAGRRDENGRLFVELKLGRRAMELLLDTGSSTTRVYADEWRPGAVAGVLVKVSNVDKASQQKMIKGKPADLELVPGVVLRKVSPLFCGRQERSMLGMDVLSQVVLVHVPTQDSPFGSFFTIR